MGQPNPRTTLGWGKGGNVTSAGWQVTLCDPIWHVSSRSGEPCCILLNPVTSLYCTLQNIYVNYMCSTVPCATVCFASQQVSIAECCLQLRGAASYYMSTSQQCVAIRLKSCIDEFKFVSFPSGNTCKRSVGGRLKLTNVGGYKPVYTNLQPVAMPAGRTCALHFTVMMMIMLSLY